MPERTSRGQDDRVLRDQFEIIQLQNQYGVAADCGDWQWFRRLFTDDVVAEFRTVGHWNNVWTGLESWATAWEEMHNQDFAATQHRMSTHVVDVLGDTASALCYGDLSRASTIIRKRRCGCSGTTMMTSCARRMGGGSVGDGFARSCGGSTTPPQLTSRSQLCGPTHVPARSLFSRASRATAGAIV